MKTLLVGNRFQSYIQESFISNSEINIHDIYSLDIMTPRGYDLIIWDGNPIYPVKDKGCVLICVGNDNVGESLSKVFQMKANAVILIKDESYDLVDALGNLWCRTSDPVELLNFVMKLYEWTKESIRRESMKSDVYIPYDVNSIVPDMNEFCNIIHDVSDMVENERGGRYFGNASTRCSKMFPSIRSHYDNEKWQHFQYILVSKRNISKDRIQPSDFIVTRYGSTGDSESTSVGKILYFGEDKPSVDTPSQINLYKEYPNINFMIHGHAYISSEFLDRNIILMTDKYCSCGDLREVYQIEKYIQHKDCDFFILNLRNHGFIIGTDTIERMRKIIGDERTKFIYRNIGEETIKL